MSPRDIASATIAGFERILRWVYPGLLFWLVLPIAVAPIDSYFGGPSNNSLVCGPVSKGFAEFYVDLPLWGHAAFVVVLGFLIYLLERYFLHEFVLQQILFCCGVGSAVNFKGRDGKEDRWYPWPTGKLIWRRFGMRPGDLNKLGERAETRLDNYLANRMAAVHALGSTGVVGVIMELIGKFVGCGSAFSSWSIWTVFYYLGLAGLFFLWGWHTWIIDRAEQDHYKPL